LAKVDKSQYTKEQWHVIREQRRKQKALDRQRKAQKNNNELKDTERTVKVPDNEPIPVSPVDKRKNYIVCLKHGIKYGSQYVNNLYSMVQRHCTLPFEFVCFTDDIREINPAIKTISLKHIGVYGWWYKPIFFDKNLPLDGNILYFDLDIVIHKNIDNLFTYNPGKFLICRDFNRSIRHDWNRMNSSVFRLVSGSLPFVFDEFMENAPMNMRRHHGDQDWIYEMLKDRKNLWMFWPDEWIQSYKWEMRDRSQLDRINGIRNFKVKADPIIHPLCNVAVFHGEPHPHQVEDDWVKDNWK
tara:strand:- start:105 stop:998 length:894 start_codon:yes stop_codon:yes gene_type:complete